MYSSTLPLTSALDGVGGQRHALAALPPGKTRPVWTGAGEYQEYFLGGKGGQWAWLTILPPSCVDGLEVW
jgi:hypothetical protein